MDNSQISSLQRIIGDLRKYPAFLEINPSLSGVRLIDNIIGAVETALEQSSEDPQLKEDYQTLKKSYPLHFKRGGYYG